MPPLGKWFRPALAAGISGGIAVGLAIATYQVKKELDDLSAQAAPGLTQGVDIWNPFSWGNVGSNLGADIAHSIDLFTKQAELIALTGALWLDVGIGLIATLYFTYKDVIQTPAQKAAEERRQILLTQAAVQGAVTAGAAAATGGATAPAAAGQVPGLAQQAVAAAPIPAIGNPEPFERGSKSRAVRDVLARHIAKGGGAEEPFAVATARVKELGPEKAAEGLPAGEIAAELAEQTAAAAREGHR